MKDICKITFGAIIAVGMVAPLQAHVDSVLENTAVWVAGTYTKASNNGMNAGNLILSPDQDTFPFYLTANNVRPLFIDPEFEWNYALGARFHVPDSHTHVFVSYDRFRDDGDRADANVFNMGIPYFSPTDETFGTAYIRQSSDEFRFGIDRGLHFGHHFCVDLSGFFEYDRLVQDSFQTITDVTSNQRGTRDTENKMRGFGPGMGALGRFYPFAHSQHWSVFGGIMSTLLFAKEDYADTLVFDDNGASSLVTIEPEQSQAVVGKLDINFGIEYACRANNKIFWDVALGMRFLNIFNAFKNGNTMNMSLPSDYAQPTATAEDWGRWGPYLQFSVGGAKS